DALDSYTSVANAPKAAKSTYLTKSFAYSRGAGASVDEESTVVEIQGGPRKEGDISIISQIEGGQEILTVCYTETCESLAVGVSDGTVKLYKAGSGEHVTTLKDSEVTQNPGPATSIKHRPVHRSHPITQTLTATYATGCVKCWHYPTGQCLYTIREKRQTLGLAYHPYLSKFVTVGDDTNLNLYDEETKTQERILHASDASDVMNGHRSRVFCAVFNPKSAHEIISGGWDDTIQFWDIRQPYATRHITGVHICGDGIDTSKTGKEILTCAWQRYNPLQLWDYGSGKLIDTLEPDCYNSLLYCGKYMNNVFVVCGGTETALIRIVDLRTHLTIGALRNLAGGVYALDIGPVLTKKAKKSKITDTPPLPKIAFCSGKTIYEIDVG
ncbi:uncharacterized protein LOC105695421, partial [Orussus abietinus]|uniref:uncharacterized protein LOC105695421 n=1 Tax=Orussus abietinus TaxID=222816 RepID=UPI000C71624C